MTICLAMLARDDAGRIGRALESAQAVCDDMLVIDTGSKDNTAEVAASYGAEVVFREWRDAGHNRTELVTLARRSADYVLTLDSDDELVVHADMPTLDAPCYSLTVTMAETKMRYSFPKLLRGDVDWRYVGRAHEYLEPTDGHEHLPALSVIHHHDRADTNTKLAEVRHQLQAALADDPSDARSCFYLAQTCRDMGDTPAAISYYKLRAAMGGWEEEGWYAAFEAARLARDADALLAAHRRRPARHEPLYALAQLATVLADETPDPADERLFVHSRDDSFI